jgi:putative FmdB family regulatory protein
MPIYEYSCQSCGKTIDVLQKISDPTPAACTACGAEGSLSKVVSRSSFVLKGGGWYSDLYSSTKKDSSSGSDSGGGSSASSSTPAASTSSTSSAPASSSAPAAAAAPAATKT